MIADEKILTSGIVTSLILDLEIISFHNHRCPNIWKVMLALLGKISNLYSRLMK
jgi:hypothetical protein